MLEMLEKAKIARKNAHFQSKTGGNFWPILPIFNLKDTWTFGQFKLTLLLAHLS